MLSIWQRQQFRYIVPANMLIAILTFWLGAGIARYLGEGIDWSNFILGIIVHLGLLAGVFMLALYFDLGEQRQAERGSKSERDKTRVKLFRVSLSILAFSSALILLLLFRKKINLPASLVLLGCVLLLLMYVLPPVAFRRRGYGEFVMAVYFGTLLPAFAFLLQTDDISRINYLLAFPLTLHALAWQIADGFSTYAVDLRMNNNSFLTRLTWQRGIGLHHFLLLFSFLIFAAVPTLGISWGLVRPVFLALPFAGLQVAWLQGIATGKPPIWNFFRVLTVTVYGFSVYLLALTVWIR